VNAKLDKAGGENMRRVACVIVTLVLSVVYVGAQTADFVDDWLFPQVPGVTSSVVHTYTAQEVLTCMTPDNADSLLCPAVRDLASGFASPGVENLLTRGSGTRGSGNDAAGAVYHWTRAFDPVETDFVIPDVCDDLNGSGELQGDGIVVSTHLERVLPDGTKETLLKIPECVTIEYRPGREPLQQVTVVSALSVDPVGGAAYFVAHSRIVELGSINGVVQSAWALVRVDGLPGVADVFRLRPRQK